ncbi:MAG: pyruvate formate lyase family protein [Pleomorphochaeta sp.]
MENIIYKNRIKSLRDKKIDQTKEKLEYEGYLDEDDYGRVVPTFKWAIIPNDEDGNFYGASGWANNFYDLMSNHDVYIDDNDAFTGRWMYFMSKMRPYKYKKSLIDKKLLSDIEYYKLDAGIGFDAHFCPDYSILLDLGFSGLIEKIEHYKKINNTDEQIEFYDNHIKVINAIQIWIQKHIDALNIRIKNEVDNKVKSDLIIKRDINSNIINNKPSSFREALQLILWYHLASRTFNRDGAGGQLDTLLIDYYNRDLALGLIDKDEATYLLSCFLINDPVYWQIGGEDVNGNDLTNEVSFLILDAAELINVSLNITIRVTKNYNKELIDRGINLLVKYKQAWPRFSGDESLVNGFMNLGFDKNDAINRIATGCNWMSLPGKEYTLNDLFKVNFAKVFEIAWNEMMDLCGYPALTNDIGTYKPVVKGSIIDKKEIPSTALLFELFNKHLKKAVHILADSMRFHLKIQNKNEVELLLNLLSYGPIEKGLDISNGGAKYYNLAIDGAAIATVADSFRALEQRIEEEKRIDWSTINSLLRTNWSYDNNDYYINMMKRSSHYCEDEKADLWAKKISDNFTDFVINESDDRYKFIPGLFSWAKPHILGKDVGATPNGRRYGDPITHGANPAINLLENPTCLNVSSAIARVQPNYGNTAPFQLEFDPFITKGNPEEIVKAIILAHFELGGTLVNVNIFNKDVILRAHKNPMQYPELVVRVTGFTAYFCMLTPEFRQQVVDRILLT